MTQPIDNTSPAPSGQGHLGALTAAAAITLLLRHADQALALENRAAAAPVRAVRKAATDVSLLAAALWVRQAGSLAAPLDPIAAANLAAQVVTRIEQSQPAGLADMLTPHIEKAYLMGARQAATALDEPSPHPIDVITPPELAVQAAGLDEAVSKRWADTERMLYTSPPENHDDLTSALAPLHAAGSDVDRDARTLINTAVNRAAHDTAVDHDTKLIWVAERDACFIASTRVLAPAVFVDSPTGAAGDVPPHPLDGLTFDPTSPRVVLSGDPGALTAAATARPIRDRFREVEAVSGREYVGDIVRIRTASGKDLTGTPNHPVATSRGWVPLGQLKVGDHVLSRSDSERVPLGVDPHDNDTPPTIEQVAQAFPVPVRVVPTAPEDFHGDGAGSDVHVVRADGPLLGEGDSAVAQHGGEDVLQRGDVCLSKLAGPRFGFLRRLRTLPSSVRFRSLLHDRSTAFWVKLMGASQVGSQSEAVAAEPAANRVHVDAVDHSYFVGCLAGLVEPDEIVEVGRREFRGQVFNLQTVEGWYLAEGIAVHNCVVCLALSGDVVGPDESFSPQATFGDKPTEWWTPPGVTLLRPPRHPRCRCRVEPWLGHAGPPGSLSLPEALKREAQRSILRGFSLPSESETVRVRAADRLLKRGSNLPKTVRAYARHAVDRGRFPTRTLPTGKENQ